MDEIQLYVNCDPCLTWNRLTEMSLCFLSTDVLSAALDSGVAISVIVIFFTLQYPRNGEIGANNIMKWWGNTVFMKTGDWDSVVLRTVPEGETFG